MKKSINGFTVVELLFIIVLIGAASIVFFIQKNNLQSMADDNCRKTAINAMYYGLEEVFYPINKFYPQVINTDNLKSVDPELFTDSNGIKIGEEGSIYTYKPTDCKDNQCKSYTLKSIMANEADYIKASRNN